MAPLALSGIRVLDLTRVLAGPLATMMLGDLGADVIKVEVPERGDDTRGWGPPFDHRGQSAYFLCTNRNKLSLAADLRRSGDRDVVRSLARGADVVVDNFRPGALDRIGLDAADLLRENQRLIWCSITGFGSDSERPGYDFVIQAESGWMAVTGERDGEPMKTGVALADVIAGKDAVVAILAALVGRARAGRAPAAAGDRRVIISLAASATASLINVAQNALLTSADARRWGNAHPNLVPYQLFHASDRALVIAVGSDAQWLACTEALGLDDLRGDAELRSNAGRLHHRARIAAAFAGVLARRTAREWMSALDKAGVPCGVVRTVLEAIHETAGASAETGMPSSVGGRVRLPPPRLDEHGTAIRRDGWGAFSRGP